MPKPIHLLRGAPAVRSWSKYQTTIESWALCGIPRKSTARPVQATENASLVSCPYCQILMRPSVRSKTRSA
jgi:hypothetical protein